MGTAIVVKRQPRAKSSCTLQQAVAVAMAPDERWCVVNRGTWFDALQNTNEGEKLSDHRVRVRGSNEIAMLGHVICR